MEDVRYWCWCAGAGHCTTGGPWPSLRPAPLRGLGPGWSRSEKCQSQQTLATAAAASPGTNSAWTIRVTVAAVRSEDCEVSSWAIVTHSQCFLFLSASYFQSTIGQCRWRIHFLWLKSEFQCALYYNENWRVNFTGRFWKLSLKPEVSTKDGELERTARNSGELWFVLLRWFLRFVL